MNESEPIALTRTEKSSRTSVPRTPGNSRRQAGPISFDRRELAHLLGMYGRKVAAGEWCDYAIDMHREKAIFSVFRRASECPLYRIEKAPRLSRRQGAYSVITPSGLILKRGHDLKNVLRAIESGLRLVQA